MWTSLSFGFLVFVASVPSVRRGHRTLGDTPIDVHRVPPVSPSILAKALIWKERPDWRRRPDREAQDRLARHVSDVGFHEFRRQLAFKAELYATKIMVADRFYASSKTCSACGYKTETLRLNDPVWTCDACGASHDRNANAAANLRDMAGIWAVTARGEESTDRDVRVPVNLASTRREPGRKNQSCHAA